jgi:RNA polymerase sigma factor (sigma-70 family)
MLDEAYEVSKDETKWVARRIMARFRRTVEKYSRKEKAAKLGYSTGDEFFYDTITIAKMLPVAFEFDSYGAVMVDKVDDGTPRKPSVPSEGGNILAVVIDIRSAIDLLQADEQVMLRNRYSNNPMTLSEIAEEMGISDSTVDRKIQGSLRKIIDHLGGPTPWV